MKKTSSAFLESTVLLLMNGCGEGSSDGLPLIFAAARTPGSDSVARPLLRETLS